MRYLVYSLCLAVGLAGAVRGDDDPLRKQVLALNNVTGDDAIRNKALDLIKKKDETAKLLKVADDMAKLDSKQFKYNSARILALSAYQLKKPDVAMRFFKICEKKAQDVKSASKLMEAFDGQYVILTEEKKYEEIEDLCKKYLEIDFDEFDDSKVFIREYRIRALTRQGKVDEALRAVNSMLDDYSDSWYIQRLKAWVLHEAGRSEEAAKLYLEVIDKLDKNEVIKPEEAERFADSIRYTLSNVFVELGQVDKAADMLKTLLKKKPDNATYNNDLGYIWADHNMNLDEAEKMIRKAIDEDRKERKKLLDEKKITPEDDKDNAAYLDSLGWVLYKKKQFAEAKKVMVDVVKEKDGQNIEIMDHLADIHMALGEKAEAIKVWKAALDQDTATRRDLKRRAIIIKKLKEAEGTEKK